MTGFYEDDEPAADVVAAFERGAKGVTGRRRPGGPMRNSTSVMNRVVITDQDGHFAGSVCESDEYTGLDVWTEFDPKVMCT